LNKNIKIFLNYFLGPVLFIVISWSLYKQIIRQPDLELRLMEIRFIWQKPLFWIVIFLMFINWGLEAKKWQILISPLESFSFLKAYKSVLAGCSVTMLTPNRIGEYGGRIVYVQEENRLKAIPLTILGSISQLFITIIVGTIGLIIFKYSETEAVLFKLLPAMAGDFLLYSSIIASVVLILLYMRVKFLVRLITRIRYMQKIVKYFEQLRSFGRKQLLRILFLSFLRYMVFILQYILLLKLIGVEIAWDLCFWILSVFYLVMALAPTIGFTELPVRAAASVELLGLYSNNIIGIQAASLGIWLINLVVPAIIGSLLIAGIKIMKEK
jgi:uncharacterized membrane protein YbhN (UPF0104 family)